MTALGKILVFMNLIFSVVTGGLIAVVFMTHTNWRLAFENLEKESRALKAQALDERTQAARKLAEAQRVARDAEKELDTKSQELARAGNELRDKEAELKREKAKFTTENIASTANTEELTRIQKERDGLKAEFAKVQGEWEKAKADAAKSREDAVANELKFKAAQAKANQLLDEVTRLNEAVVAAKKGGGPAVAAVGNPPPAQNLRGTIREFDPKNGLATVTVGTDSGLKVNNSLFVYRLDPEPVYLGKLTILNAQAKQAVGRFDPAAGGRKSPPKVGDQVADKLQ